MRLTHRIVAIGLPAGACLTVVGVPAGCSTQPTAVSAGSDGGQEAAHDGDASGDITDVLLTNPGACTNPADWDDDLVADSLELAPSQDTDGDGIRDWQDTDSDNDGYPDAQEASNPFLPEWFAGKTRDDPCSPLADSDGDGIPDLRDVDADNDSVLDVDERAYDKNGSHRCNQRSDCDSDGILDVVELAAGSDPLDPSGPPTPPLLYFVLPYMGAEQTRDFEFSVGVKLADVYFLIDTTESMQPAIDSVAASIDTAIVPAILNGDPSATPQIPAIPRAWIGVGDFRDIPWAPWGATTDNLYRNRFKVGSATLLGNVVAPEQGPNGLEAPSSVRSILGSLQAEGGGDAPEGLTQALWIASTGQAYSATLGGSWTADPPQCTPPGAYGAPCFRHDALPVLVTISDAPMHNGPQVSSADSRFAICHGALDNGHGPSPLWCCSGSRCRTAWCSGLLPPTSRAGRVSGGHGAEVLRPSAPRDEPRPARNEGRAWRWLATYRCERPQRRAWREPRRAISPHNRRIPLRRLGERAEGPSCASSRCTSASSGRRPAPRGPMRRNQSGSHA